MDIILGRKQKMCQDASERIWQSRYVEEARRTPGETGYNLLQLLERRLDSVVYRLGFRRTRPMARQVVNYGHILVNNRQVNIPSYRVQVRDVMTLTPRAREIPGVQEGKVSQRC